MSAVCNWGFDICICWLPGATVTARAEGKRLLGVAAVNETTPHPHYSTPAAGWEMEGETGCGHERVSGVLLPGAIRDLGFANVQRRHI